MRSDRRLFVVDTISPVLSGAGLRRAIPAIGRLRFRGMRWRAIGQYSGIPFGSLFTLFARWIRLGSWRHLLDRPRRTWRLACGAAPESSAVVIDSRSYPNLGFPA